MLKTVKLFSVIFLLHFIYGCNHREFPLVKELSEYQKTDFNLTMEDSLNTSHNTIYCSSFLYAWNEIRTKLSSLTMENKFAELNRINNSTSWQNSLLPDEIETSVSINGENIEASAYFKKSLPFEFKLERFPEPLIFKNEKVKSFGFHNDFEKIDLVSRIVFYNNDSDFAVKLFPKDADHEIILYNPSADTFTNFQQLYELLNEKANAAKADPYNKKYSFNEGDFVQIPLLTFNIETTYKNLVGNTFKSSGQDHFITKADQRTAFLLDELGAEIESEAHAGEATAIAPQPEDHPKHMVFNKSFLVILKRKDNINPYFMAWINNAELMNAF